MAGARMIKTQTRMAIAMVGPRAAVPLPINIKFHMHPIMIDIVNMTRSPNIWCRNISNHGCSIMQMTNPRTNTIREVKRLRRIYRPNGLPRKIWTQNGLFHPAFSEFRLKIAISPLLSISSTAKPKKPKDFEPVINKLHTVFPAMGKRSIRDRPLSSRQKFHIDHHRKTRHELYDIVENYLFA